MHPRTKIRRELAELLKAIGVPVYTSRARDLRRDDDEAIIIYVPDEELSRPIGDGEGALRAANSARYCGGGVGHGDRAWRRL